MKIIAVDNFDREIHSDVLICENVNKFYGRNIVQFLNDKFCAGGKEEFCAGGKEDLYFKLVEDSHTLKIGLKEDDE